MSVHAAPVQCIQCSLHGALSCQETVGACDTCGARTVDINRYRASGQPEALCLDCLAAGKHMASAHDRTKADVETITSLAARPAGQGGFTPSWEPVGPCGHTLCAPHGSLCLHDGRTRAPRSGPPLVESA